LIGFEKMSVRTCNSREISVAIVAAFLAGTPAHVSASSILCEPPTVDSSDWAKKSLSEADIVILGRVVWIKNILQKEPDPAETNGAKSMAELIRLMEAVQALPETRFDHVISFEVIESWKTPTNPVVRTRIYLGRLNDIRSYEIDEVFLVVGRNLEATLYTINNPCIDAIREDWAQEYVDALDALTPRT
jgi:hypothetical protein